MRIEGQMKLLNLRFTTKYLTYAGFISSLLVALFNTDVAVLFFFIGGAAWATNLYLGPVISKYAPDAIELLNEQYNANNAEAL